MQDENNIKTHNQPSKKHTNPGIQKPEKQDKPHL